MAIHAHRPSCSLVMGMGPLQRIRLFPNCQTSEALANRSLWLISITMGISIFISRSTHDLISSCLRHLLDNRPIPMGMIVVHTMEARRAPRHSPHLLSPVHTCCETTALLLLLMVNSTSPISRPALASVCKISLT